MIKARFSEVLFSYGETILLRNTESKKCPHISTHFLLPYIFGKLMYNIFVCNLFIPSVRKCYMAVSGTFSMQEKTEI